MDALSKVLSTDLATVDGLDNIFEAVSTDVMAVTSDTPSTLDTTADTVRTWSLQEAADNLGLSTRTVLRKLKTGSLHGHKIMGTNGPEWRITPLDTEPLTQATVKSSVKAVTSDKQSTQDTPHDTMAQALLKVIESQAEQLKAASEVIMYQRSQLEDRDSTIKLLTDSQHKPSWWRRFGTWLTGRS